MADSDCPQTPSRTYLSNIFPDNHMKKRGNLYLSLVPHFEALALPITVRTSNAEAHADMYNNPSSLKKTQSETREHYIPRKHLPLLCF